jgi:purine-binding chemotaxis protein CheW
MEQVIFKLDNENYALGLDKIKEILVYSEVIITELFNEDRWVKGLINLRGEVIPIIDLRALFGIEEKEYDQNSVIIVVNTSDDKLVGIIVDNISSIMELNIKSMVPAPSMGISIDPRYVKGLVKFNNNEMSVLLDIDCILKTEVIA